MFRLCFFIIKKKTTSTHFLVSCLFILTDLINRISMYTRHFFCYA